jgi:hypothetical protein
METEYAFEIRLRSWRTVLRHSRAEHIINIYRCGSLKLRTLVFYLAIRDTCKKNLNSVIKGTGHKYFNELPKRT